MTLSPPPSNWEEAILITARQFMNAEVCFYRVVEDDEDDITGTGGSRVEVIWRGKARVQHLRSPRDAPEAYQSGDIRSFRFQLDPADNPPQLFSGAKARVLDGGRDESLLQYAYSVDSAVNSSHMAVRTVELKAKMRPHAWTWEP